MNAGTYTPAAVGGGFATGFAVNAIGYLIHEQMSKSDAVDDDYVAGWKSKARQSLPKQFGAGLQNRLKQEMRKSEALGGKLVDDSVNQVEVTITEYGYRKAGQKDKKILLTPYLAGTVSVKADGKVLLRKRRGCRDFREWQRRLSNCGLCRESSSAQSHFTTAQRKFAAEVSSLVASALEN